MTEILVTGAGGFIGSTVCQRLVNQGYKVRALCRYSSRNHIGWLDEYEKKDKIKYIFGDIRDPSVANKAIPENGFVINMAALIGIPYSYDAPNSYVDTNILGAINYLNKSLNKNIQGFIQTSTSETYGSAQYVPIDENHPLVGQSPYSASKIAADQLALSYYYSFGLPVAILRPFNTYGPRQSTRAFIPTVISQIINQDSSTINLGNLESFRDFNYVDDTADAFLAVIENFDKCKGEVLNSCSNFQVSMKEVVNLLQDISGTNKEIYIDKNRLRPATSEVDRLWGENKKILSITNWSPNYSGIDGFKQGLKNTYEWYANRNDLKQNASIYNK